MYVTTEPVLVLKDISLEFGEKKILRSINLDVLDIESSNTVGQVVTLLGRSGVGKTQLMKIIAGLQRPTTGQVLISKKMTPVKAGMVGMVLQTYPLFMHRTVMGNLLLVSSNKELILNYLEEFDLIDHKDKYPKNLSGGQKQRVAIVQQLLCSSHLILLDEPFSGLDPVATEKLCQNISKVANHDSENTVIISSHILEPSLAISDEVWMIGHEKNGDDKIPGATVIQEYNLAEMGLAWQPGIRENHSFVELTKEIRNKFYEI